jgi:5-(carboxyamino)imidazole ribonucleotide mutase
MNVVSIIMGSQSDYETMRHAEEILQFFDIKFETKIVSAHRTPKRLYEFCQEVEKKGFKIIIAGAGGAAHLPGMTASMTQLPVLGVPIKSKTLDGLDSLLSIAQMPAGIPVATLAIGEAGAKNAGLLAVAILALQDKKLMKKLQDYRKKQTNNIGKIPLPSKK